MPGISSLPTSAGISFKPAVLVAESGGDRGVEPSVIKAAGGNLIIGVIARYSDPSGAGNALDAGLLAGLEPAGSRIVGLSEAVYVAPAAERAARSEGAAVMVNIGAGVGPDTGITAAPSAVAIVVMPLAEAAPARAGREAAAPAKATPVSPAPPWGPAGVKSPTPSDRRSVPGTADPRVIVIARSVNDGPVIGHFGAQITGRKGVS